VTMLASIVPQRLAGAKMAAKMAIEPRMKKTRKVSMISRVREIFFPSRYTPNEQNINPMAMRRTVSNSIGILVFNWRPVNRVKRPCPALDAHPPRSTRGRSRSASQEPRIPGRVGCG